MEFPEDVLALIREYSRPLKRRIISNYWITQGSTDAEMSINEKAEWVFEEFKQYWSPSAVMRTYDWGWEIYDDEDDEEDDYFADLKVVFDKTKLLEWDGNFELENGYCDGMKLLGKDTIMYKQLLNDTRVVKEKNISFIRG